MEKETKSDKIRTFLKSKAKVRKAKTGRVFPVTRKSETFQKAKRSFMEQHDHYFR